jgi:hypothetical protein
MEHERDLDVRQRIEREAIRRLALHGIHDPRLQTGPGVVHDFRQWQAYDEKLASEIRLVTKITATDPS